MLATSEGIVVGTAKQITVDYYFLKYIFLMDSDYWDSLFNKKMKEKEFID